MNERCHFCGGAVDQTTRVCWACRRLQPVGAASGQPFWHCPRCGEPAQPDDRMCRRCGSPLQAPCPHCRQAVPVWATFCPHCAQPLGALVAEKSDRGIIAVPFIPLETGVAQPSGVSSAPAGPQSGLPGVSSAPAGPQSGAPGVPTAPGGVPGGPSGWPSNSPARRLGKAAGQSLRAKLLGTASGKVIAAVLAVALVVAGGAAVLLVRAGSPSSTASQKAGTLTKVSLPNSGNIPADITAGPDGNLWLSAPCTPLDQTVDCTGSEILRVTPAGKVTAFPLTGNGQIGGITAGPDGNLWFTVSNSNSASQIGRMSPAGQMSEFPLAGFYGVTDITAGPDGNLWFTRFGKIGRITPGGQITEFPLAASTDPHYITAGPDGNLWFTDSTSTGSREIGRITPGGQRSEFPVPNAGDIAAGPDGNLWFTAETGKIGRITTNGHITEFPLPRADSNAQGVTAGADGNIWFTACTPQLGAPGGCIYNQIDRITPGGQMTVYSLQPGTVPVAITTGPDKNLWFTEPYSNEMGRITSGK